MGPQPDQGRLTARQCPGHPAALCSEQILAARSGRGGSSAEFAGSPAALSRPLLNAGPSQQTSDCAPAIRVPSRTPTVSQGLDSAQPLCVRSSVPSDC